MPLSGSYPLLFPKLKLFFVSITAVFLSACAATISTPTAGVTIDTPIDTPKPTQTQTRLPSPTATQSIPTVTQTLIPIVPSITFSPSLEFSKSFELYRAWIGEDKRTNFYFFRTGIDVPFFGVVSDGKSEHEITCHPDEKYPLHSQCISEDYIFGKSLLKFTFYSDPDQNTAFFTGEFQTGLSSDSTWLGDNCESEYRIYDGVCYEAHTCYDNDGNVIWSYDNIPYGGTFEGYSSPCP